MAIEWKYRGRIFNFADIESIRRLIAANPNASRWALSRKLCEDWNWKQANGALRDMVCRGLLLMVSFPQACVGSLATLFCWKYPIQSEIGWPKYQVPTCSPVSGQPGRFRFLYP